MVRLERTYQAIVLRCRHCRAESLVREVLRVPPLLVEAAQAAPHLRATSHPVEGSLGNAQRGVEGS